MSKTALHSIYRAKESDRRLTVVNILINTTCNYRCSYCSEEFYNGRYELELKTIQRFLDRAVDHYGALGRRLYILYSGGEPTLYRNFFELMRYGKALGCYNDCVSNGSRPITWWRKVAPMLDHVSLSFSPEFSDIEKFAKKAQILSQYFLVHINVLMVQRYFTGLIKTLDFFSNISERISVSPKPIRANRMKFDDYTEDEFAFIRNWELNGKGNPNLRAFPLLLRFSDGSKVLSTTGGPGVHGFTRFLGWGCEAGVSFISVMFDGNLLSCQNGVRYLGNIHEDFWFPSESVVCPTDGCLSECNHIIPKALFEGGTQHQVPAQLFRPSRNK
jgi:organic radical activating enzyme